jgi:type IV pilus assembly protein PilE
MDGACSHGNWVSNQCRLTKVLPANLSWSTDASKRYQIEMKASSTAAYTLIAKRKNPGAQATDKCGDFTLSNTGVKSADNVASGTTASDCWTK